MTNNKFLCIIPSIFASAIIYTMSICINCSPFIEYEKSLDENQKMLYKQSVNERQKIYIIGLIIGIIIATLYYVYRSTNNLNKNAVNDSCILLSIVLFTQYIVYMIYPKKINMVTLMNNKEQLEKWNDVYKYMQNRYYTGMLIGGVGYVILSIVMNN